MTLARAIRLAHSWAFGGICTLKEGEAQEYHRLALAALCAQQEAEQNEPLTLDELRTMDGEPMWLAAIGEDFDDGWYLIVAVDSNRLHCLQLYTMLFFEHYGKTWLAYRRKLVNARADR